MTESLVLNISMPVGTPLIWLICAVVSRGSRKPLAPSSSSRELTLITEGLAPILTWALSLFFPKKHAAVSKRMHLSKRVFITVWFIYDHRNLIRDMGQFNAF